MLSFILSFIVIRPILPEMSGMIQLQNSVPRVVAPK